VYAREGNYEDALEALRRSGNEAEAYNDVGYIAMMDGRYGEAITFFQEAIRLAPTYYAAANENAGEARRKSLKAKARGLD
jgi:tetratricopeptide (TPR) repeat protein